MTKDYTTEIKWTNKLSEEAKQLRVQIFHNEYNFSSENEIDRFDLDGKAMHLEVYLIKPKMINEESWT